MKTASGHVTSLIQIMRRHARYGNVEGFRAYVRSDAFLKAFVALDPMRRQTAMRAYTEAATLCEAKARHPLREPKSIAEGGRCKPTNWRDPAMLAKLRSAKTDEMAARLCGVTLKAAQIARKRYLDINTTDSCRQAA